MFKFSLLISSRDTVTSAGLQSRNISTRNMSHMSVSIHSSSFSGLAGMLIHLNVTMSVNSVEHHSLGFFMSKNVTKSCT